jgi:hypothetical protein
MTSIKHYNADILIYLSLEVAVLINKLQT